MSARRALGETLVEVASSTFDALAAAPGIQVREFAVTLPIELALRRSGDQVQLLGDLPRQITRTAFDIRPARIEIVWVESEPS